MEAAAAATVVRSSGCSCKPSFDYGRFSILASNRPSFARFHSNFQFSSSKLCTFVSNPKQGYRGTVLGNRRGLVVRAASSFPESSESSNKIAPLQLESPIGQFLSQILISHPHLVPAAVEQQLEQLQIDRDADKHKQEPSTSSTDIVLYRRIAEVKANERRKALEEMLYALVVQKFMEANIALLPSISPGTSDQVDSWPSEDEKLEQLHSPEAYEMIQHHLALILGSRLDDSTYVAQISKIRVGQVYAASVMYGYFLKRVDQRFQLEKTMKILPNAVQENIIQQTIMDGTRRTMGEEESSRAESHPEVPSDPSAGSSPAGFGYGTKVSRLRNYVMSFDGETLQRFATIRSKEAISIIEKHTEALLGRPGIVVTPEGAIDSSKDENIKISFGGLKRLVLEAVTFGSFLWDVESFVDYRYHFVLN
ncbi:UV-B-induced protein [Senna tora]|uniref:UV-B-induced protein n=1 Tax=Senna tora TaxID=362788 RepID=A0A834THF8_9FABA|nr:UV-B-induced protein [Senna tora]